MTEGFKMWIEIILSIIYMVMIWSVVVSMIIKFKHVDYKRITTARCFLWAYAALAIGDTLYWGTRALTYITGGLGAGRELADIGVLAASAAVTVFYIFLIFVWKNRYSRNINFLAVILILFAAGRLAMLFMHENGWTNFISSDLWLVCISVPLVILAAGVIFLILSDSAKNGDGSFRWIGIMLLISLIMYIPALILPDMIPAVVVLTIPEAIAYIIGAFIGYNTLFIKGR